MSVLKRGTLISAHKKMFQIEQWDEVDIWLWQMIFDRDSY